MHDFKAHEEWWWSYKCIKCGLEAINTVRGGNVFYIHNSTSQLDGVNEFLKRRRYVSINADEISCESVMMLEALE